jgi:predicted nucleic acid-binding protein
MPSRDAVFVDTSGWIALLNADDQLHTRAATVLRQCRLAQRLLFTTDWVLAETGNGLARTAARRQFPIFVKTLMQSAHSRIVWINDSSFARALEMYEKSHDKNWGIVDCASFGLMRDEGILEALTADQHFRQAGFQCLL